MRKQRRKFETGFKQQIVSEVQAGLLSVSAASRKYHISASIIDRWRQKAQQGALQTTPSSSGKSPTTGEPRDKGEAGRAVSGERPSKKLGYLLHQHKNVTTSVITAESLARQPKGSKS